MYSLSGKSRSSISTVWQLSLSFPASVFCYCESAVRSFVWLCGCTCECVAISKSDSNNNASIMSERENECEARRERERRAEVRRRQDHANGILVESFAIYFYCSSLIESVEATKSHRRPDKSVRQCKTPLKTHTGHKKYINNSTLKY